MLENQGIFSMKQGTESPYYETYEREQACKDCVRFLHIRQQRKKRKVELQLPLINACQKIK